MGFGQWAAGVSMDLAPELSYLRYYEMRRTDTVQSTTKYRADQCSTSNKLFTRYLVGVSQKSWLDQMKDESMIDSNMNNK